MWARTLQESDVVLVEAIDGRLPDVHRPYRRYERQEWPEIIRLLNGTPSWPLAKRVTLLLGTSPTYFITTSDGLRHSYRFDVNHVLRIDGVAYQADYQWLVDSFRDIEGNDPVPSDFEFRPTAEFYR